MKPALSLSAIGRAVTVGALLLVLALPNGVAAATAKKVVATKKNTRYAANLYIPGKVYKDEKVAFENPTSRCSTPAMQTLHKQTVAIAIKDMSGFDVSPTSTSPYAKPAQVYLDGLAVLWDAMEEPYCGYGAFGLTAAKHSYEKTANHLRTAFLDEVKKITKAAAK